MLDETADRVPEAVALRFKSNGTWQTVRYEALRARSLRVAAGLAHAGIRHGDRVAMLLENGPAWPEIYFGIVRLGAAAVPIDTRLREMEIVHLLRHAAAKLLFTEAGLYAGIPSIGEQLPDLEHVVILNGPAPDACPGRGGPALARYEAWREAPADNDRPPDCTPEDTASIIYTSGTTGRAKGVVLSHANFMADVDSCLNALTVGRHEVFLLVLPLHHAFAFTANLLAPVRIGAELGFVENLRSIGDNVRDLAPTIIIGVPLLIEKMYARIMAGLQRQPLARLLYNTGVRAPVTRGIRKNFGGRLRLIVVGGAPSAPEVLQGFARLGLTILEGYGMTETAPVLTLNRPGRIRIGTVGPPLPGVELRIDAPGEDGSGEILARGPMVMQGYYHDPEATAAVFADGWLRTGDLGMLDADGYLTITGRKKSLIVNREGKNIHPEEVESAIETSPLIREALALGFRMPGETGERVGVIVVPDIEAFDALERRENRVLSDEEMAERIREAVRTAARSLADYKQPRRVQIRAEEFEKTSTGKIKRYLYVLATAER